MEKKQQLALMANKLRIHALKSTTAAGSGHPTSCMSIAEIMSCLFFSEIQRGDEFILSKGHAAPILWAVFAEAGLVERSELLNLRKMSSNLEGHPTPNMPLIKVASGSLGQGLSAGLGTALAMRLQNSNARTFVILGDGECAEGSVWEAANIASYYSVNNLCAIVDVNRLGQSDATMFDHNDGEYGKRFEAFGWETVSIDGHNVEEILDAFARFKKSTKPFAIIARTYKGKGVSFLENKEGWHGKPVNETQLKEALQEIGDASIELPCAYENKKVDAVVTTCAVPHYNKGDQVATRQAFGDTLVKLGNKNEQLVVVDGDVKNSTMTDKFFATFPERSFESFIAEQNMVGMTIGLASQGYIPFTATFAAFLTRAHDFIRMAAYSKANIKIIGSHSGLSIGEDGPSQMGLEDLALFLSIPGAIVLYPSDAVATAELVCQMGITPGLAYLKTTRGKTPVIYDNGEKFPIGGLKVVRQSDQDQGLLIAAGITLQEALNAYESLKAKNIYMRVIDLYSIQPVDGDALKKHARECNNRVYVVEDQYFGGIGTVVAQQVGSITHLYVTEIPRSGKPAELMHVYGIDAAAIEKKVLENQ